MVISTGQKYRGFDITQRVGIPCGADFQSAQSPLRERLPFFGEHPAGYGYWGAGILPAGWFCRAGRPTPRGVPREDGVGRDARHPDGDNQWSPADDFISRSTKGRSPLAR